MKYANGASATRAIAKRSRRYANGVTSSSASATSGKVTPKKNAARTSEPSAAYRRFTSVALLDVSRASGW